MRGRYDIVASVTRAIAHRLQDAVNQTDGAIAQTLVTTRRPGAGDPGSQPQINVYLFQVTPNPYLRNLHEPWRVDGRQVEQPATALDLFYLLSFTGSEDIDRLEPQRLLGIVTNALNVNATIVETDLQPTGAGTKPAPIAAPTTSVQLTPHSLTVEEMSRLWAMFPQAPYQLSVCYRASAALVVADVPLQPSPPPVQVSPNVASGLPPVIDEVVLPVGGAVYGDVLTLRGQKLAAADTQVLLDGVALPVGSVSDSEVTFTAGAPGVAAGQDSLRVARASVVSDPVTLRLGPVVQSSRAKVKADGGVWSGHVELTLAPPLQPGQTLELDLFSAGGDGGSYGFIHVEPFGDAPTTKVEVPVTGVAAGQYAVRATVDGAAGRLTRDAQGAYAKPLLTIGG